MDDITITPEEALMRTRTFLIGRLFAIKRDANKIRPLIKGISYGITYRSEIMLIRNQISEIINPALGLDFDDLSVDIEGMPLFSKEGNLVVSVGELSGTEIEP